MVVSLKQTGHQPGQAAPSFGLLLMMRRGKAGQETAMLSVCMCAAAPRQLHASVVCNSPCVGHSHALFDAAGCGAGCVYIPPVSPRPRPSPSPTSPSPSPSPSSPAPSPSPSTASPGPSPSPSPSPNPNVYCVPCNLNQLTTAMIQQCVNAGATFPLVDSVNAPCKPLTGVDGTTLRWGSAPVNIVADVTGPVLCSVVRANPNQQITIEIRGTAIPGCIMPSRFPFDIPPVSGRRTRHKRSQSTQRASGL